MSQGPEAKVKREVKKQLKALGAYQYWPVTQGFGATTVDCLACLAGAFVAIETKAPGKKPTPLQLTTLERIRISGGISLVIDSVDMAKSLPETINAEYHVVARESGSCFSGGLPAGTVARLRPNRDVA
jgi:hypothetical protein